MINLFGELNDLETISFLSVINKVDRFLISIPDPYSEEKYIDIYVSPENSTNVSIDTSTSSPYIKLKFDFTGRIYSMSNNSDYLSSEVLDSISSSCDAYLESLFSNFLYKTSKELKSDICGLGKYALSNFLTSYEFEDYDWLFNYKDAFFDVEVNSSIKSGMLITETS